MNAQIHTWSILKFALFQGQQVYDQYHAASRSPLSDTARTFAAVYVSIYPFFEGGCFFFGGWQLHQSMPFRLFGAFK